MLEKQKQLYHVWGEPAYLVMSGRESRIISEADNDFKENIEEYLNKIRGIPE
jgi:hypothetical protein